MIPSYIILLLEIGLSICIAYIIVDFEKQKDLELMLSKIENILDGRRK